MEIGSGQRNEPPRKNYIDWDYHGTDEEEVKAERTERGERYSNYIETHPIYQRAKNETLKAQLYFTFLQNGGTEVIDYFFRDGNDMTSFDLDCYRLLSKLYSLSAVRGRLIEKKRPITLTEIHDFIYEQEILLHPDSIKKEERPALPDGGLTEENKRILDELLTSISRNTCARSEYEKRMEQMAGRMDELRETFHKKEVDYSVKIAELREQLAAAKSSARNSDEMTDLKIENEKMKLLTEKEEEIRNLKLNLSRSEDEVKMLRNRVSELLDSGVPGKAVRLDTLPASETENIKGTDKNTEKRKEPLKVLWKKKKSKQKFDKEEIEKSEFLKKVLRNPEYPGYQLEFIGQCYQENFSINELEFFSTPGIPEENLSIMKRIIINSRDKIKITDE